LAAWRTKNHSPFPPRDLFPRRFEFERLAADGRLDAREVVLDRAPDPAPVAAARSAYTVARLSEDRPERVTIEVASDAPGILVLLDLYYPGWTASVDGRRSELLRANGVFRAVALPAGSHRVVFQYRPVSFYAGAAVASAAWLAVLLLSLSGDPARREALL
jgi:hypothetical protein